MKRSEYIAHLVCLAAYLLLAAFIVSCCAGCTSATQQTQNWQASCTAWAQAVAPAHVAEAARRSAE